MDAHGRHDARDPRSRRSPVYPGGSRVNDRGHLVVGGCDVVELAAEFGTPTYIYVEDDMRARARAYLDAFRARGADFEVLYASKAAPITAVYRLFAEQGLSVDVASGGELHMALRAGFDPERVYLHGNNKTEAELRYAAEAGVGHVILDSFAEIARLDAMLDRPQDVLIRVTPGILPSTHSYVQTGGLDSKFGFGLEDGLAARAIAEVLGSRNLRLVGLHAHIGSQIFELEPYAPAIEALAGLAGRRRGSAGSSTSAGASGSPTPRPTSRPRSTPTSTSRCERRRAGLRPRAADPDRAGAVARRQRGRDRVRDRDRQGDPERPDLPVGRRGHVGQPAADALRVALRGDRRESRGQAPDTPATVAGMHCESGDILITDAMLASPEPGDILVTPATGAYGYSMASNYNGVAAARGRLLQGRRRSRGRAARDVGRPGLRDCELRGAAFTQVRRGSGPLRAVGTRFGARPFGHLGGRSERSDGRPRRRRDDPAGARRSPGCSGAARATSTGSSRTRRSSSS